MLNKLKNITLSDVVAIITGSLIDFSIFCLIGLFISIFISLSKWFFIGAGIGIFIRWIYMYFKNGSI